MDEINIAIVNKLIRLPSIMWVGLIPSVEDLNRINSWDAWVAQLVKYLTLDFGSGHDPMFPEFEPHVRLCADSAEPAWDSLSPHLSLPLPRLCMHSYKQT